MKARAAMRMRVALLQYGDTPVALAAVEGKLEAVQALHAAGADMVDPKVGWCPVVGAWC